MPNEISGQSPSGDPKEPSPTQPIPSPVEQSEVGERGKGNANGNQPDAKSFAKEIHWVHAATLGTQVVLGVVGIFALIIYHGQLTVMSGQLDQMKVAGQQAKMDNAASITAQKDIAEKALAISQENFAKSSKSASQELRLNQRAWIYVTNLNLEELRIGDPFTAKMTLRNNGRTFAFPLPDSIIYMSVSPRPLPKLTPSFDTGLPYTESVMAPDTPYTLTVSTKPRQIVGKGDILAFPQKHIWVYIFGVVSYRDVFQESHKTSICFVTNGDLLFTGCPEYTYPVYAN